MFSLKCTRCKRGNTEIRVNSYNQGLRPHTLRLSEVQNDALWARIVEQCLPLATDKDPRSNKLNFFAHMQQFESYNNYLGLFNASEERTLIPLKKLTQEQKKSCFVIDSKGRPFHWDCFNNYLQTKLGKTNRFGEYHPTILFFPLIPSNREYREPPVRTLVPLVAENAFTSLAEASSTDDPLYADIAVSSRIDVQPASPFRDETPLELKKLPRSRSPSPEASATAQAGGEYIEMRSPSSSSASNPMYGFPKNVKGVTTQESNVDDLQSRHVHFNPAVDYVVLLSMPERYPNLSDRATFLDMANGEPIDDLPPSNSRAMTPFWGPYTLFNLADWKTYKRRFVVMLTLGSLGLIGLAFLKNSPLNNPACTEEEINDYVHNVTLVFSEGLNLPGLNSTNYIEYLNEGLTKLESGTALQFQNATQLVTQLKIYIPLAASVCNLSAIAALFSQYWRPPTPSTQPDIHTTQPSMSTPASTSHSFTTSANSSTSRVTTTAASSPTSSSSNTVTSSTLTTTAGTTAVTTTSMTMTPITTTTTIALSPTSTTTLQVSTTSSVTMTPTTGTSTTMTLTPGTTMTVPTSTTTLTITPLTSSSTSTTVTVSSTEPTTVSSNSSSTSTSSMTSTSVLTTVSSTTTTLTTLATTQLSTFTPTTSSGKVTSTRSTKATLPHLSTLPTVTPPPPGRRRAVDVINHEYTRHSSYGVTQWYGWGTQGAMTDYERQLLDTWLDNWLSSGRSLDTALKTLKRSCPPELLPLESIKVLPLNAGSGARPMSLLKVLVNLLEKGREW